MVNWTPHRSTHRVAHEVDQLDDVGGGAARVGDEKVRVDVAHLGPADAGALQARPVDERPGRRRGAVAGGGGVLEHATGALGVQRLAVPLRHPHLLVPPPELVGVGRLEVERGGQHQRRDDVHPPVVPDQVVARPLVGVAPGVHDRQRRDGRPEVAVPSAGVHPRRPADAGGDAAERLDARQPGPDRLQQQLLQVGPRAGPHGRAVDVDRREGGGVEPEHRARHAVVGDQQVAPLAQDVERDAVLAAPPQRVGELVDRPGPDEVAGRAAELVPRHRRERHVAGDEVEVVERVGHRRGRTVRGADGAGGGRCGGRTVRGAGRRGVSRRGRGRPSRRRRPPS